MKRLFVVLLALSFVFLTVTPAFAAENQGGGPTPLIVVGGMNGAPLIKDEGTPNEEQVWPPVLNFGEIAVKAILGLSSAAVYKDWDKLGDVIVPLLNKVLEPSSCDNDGNSKYNVSTTTYPLSMANYPEFLAEAFISEEGFLHSASDRLGAENVYFFNYDWRLDPLEHARALDAMIQRVKAETGCSKVDITACSMGGCVTMAYFYLFGYGDVESCVFLSAAFSGSLAASEILVGEVFIDRTALKHYIRLNVNINPEVDEFLDAFVEFLDQTGVLKTIVDFVNGMLSSQKDRVLDEAVTASLGTMPGMWALVREGAFEQAKEMHLSDPKYAKLVERIDDFHYNVRVKRQELIENAMESGVTVYFTSHYEDVLIPAFPSAIKHGDGLIETVCTSNGATVALLGERFPKDYVQANPCCGKNHVSPDRVVDASTCMFPEQVWFFREVAHVGTIYQSEFSDFILWFLEQPEQATVWSDAAHPQFLTAGDAGMTLHPTTEADGEYYSLADGVADFFKAWTNIKNILK